MSDPLTNTVVIQPTAYEVEVIPGPPNQLVVRTVTREVVEVSLGGPQGPKGDKGDAGSIGTPTYSAENKDSATLAAGAVVAVHGSGIGIIRAVATGPGTAAAGFVQATTAPTFAADIQTDWTLTLSDWSAVTDEGNPTLAARAVYYLSTTPGKITVTAPTIPGRIVQVVGYAVASDTLEIGINEPILL